MSTVEVAAADLGRVTAEWIAVRLADAVGRKGVAHLALSGGSTPWAAFELLTTLDVPWDRVHLWQVDERIAPDGDPQRNATGLHRSLLDPLLAAGAGGPTPHLMPAGSPSADPTSLAADYERALRAAGDPPVLDVVHLGLGPDGHTASWVPGDDVIDAPGEVAATSTVYQGTRRMTLTPRCVNRADARVILVSGPDKADALGRLLSGDREIPASRVRPEGTTVITDIATDAPASVR